MSPKLGGSEGGYPVFHAPSSDGVIAGPANASEGAGARRVALNALVPGAAGLLGKVLDLGFALLYFRVLGEEASGVYKFLVVFITYLDTLVNFGLNTIVARDVARQPGNARSVFRSVVGLRFVLWLVGLPIVGVVLGPGASLAELPPEAAVAGGVFYLALLPSILASSASGVLWGFEKLDVTAGVAVGTTVVKIVLGSFLLLAGWGVTGLAVTSVAANLLTAGVLLGVMRLTLRTISPSGEERAPGPTSLAEESWPLFVNQLLAGLFFKIDSLLLPGLAGLRAAGAYGVAYTVVDGVGVISSSLTLALFPRLARMVGGEGGLDAAYRLALRFLLQVAFPLATGIALLAEPIVELIGGRTFLPDGALALAVVIWFLPLSFANGLTQYVLIALGQQRFLTRCFAAALAFNLVANVLLIPRFGLLGAAAVTVASEVVVLLPFRWKARQLAPGVSLPRECVHGVLATLVMAPIVWWIHIASHPVLAVAGGLLAYPAALWMLGGVNRQQRQVLRSLRAPGDTESQTGL